MSDEGLLLAISTVTGQGMAGSSKVETAYEGSIKVTGRLLPASVWLKWLPLPKTLDREVACPLEGIQRWRRRVGVVFSGISDKIGSFREGYSRFKEIRTVLLKSRCP